MLQVPAPTISHCGTVMFFLYTPFVLQGQVGSFSIMQDLNRVSIVLPHTKTVQRQHST